MISFESSIVLMNIKSENLIYSIPKDMGIDLRHKWSHHSKQQGKYNQLSVGSYKRARFFVELNQCHILLALVLFNMP